MSTFQPSAYSYGILDDLFGSEEEQAERKKRGDLYLLVGGGLGAVIGVALTRNKAPSQMAIAAAGLGTVGAIAGVGIELSQYDLFG